MASRRRVAAFPAGSEPERSSTRAAFSTLDQHRGPYPRATLAGARRVLLQDALRQRLVSPLMVSPPRLSGLLAGRPREPTRLRPGRLADPRGGSYLPRRTEPTRPRRPRSPGSPPESGPRAVARSSSPRGRGPRLPCSRPSGALLAALG